MKFEIKDRWTGAVKFECNLPARVAKRSYAGQLGYAVQQAYKKGVNLSNTDLSEADLAYATLAGATLNCVNLAYADLKGANLSGTNLVRANLVGVNFAGANLAGANLAGADLSIANLDDTNLNSTNLVNATINNAKLADLAIARTRILPEGDIIGWKKCKDDVIVKLRIPAEARRYHAFGRKCRAEFADVLEVIGAEVGISKHDGKTKYRVGERVVPDRFDDDWSQECAPGIHFFITRIEAEEY